jgi:hypothetical protein
VFQHTYQYLYRNMCQYLYRNMCQYLYRNMYQYLYRNMYQYLYRNMYQYHRQSVKNATISIASARHGVIPVENARPRAGGSGRSVLGASASRAARSRRRRRWATPRKEIVS